MNILSELKNRFRPALAEFVADPASLLDMIRPAQDAKFGDYQANCAMPLGKQIGKSPREVATAIIEKVGVADLCEPPEIAGPGFINLRLKNEWLVAQITKALDDPRLGVPTCAEPKTFVIDYSSPNVAKPMHVGHIRSTVIGDALTRALRFLGHKVISDNHLGDWGTQFGMIIYGYKHFVDPQAYQQSQVAELGRLYRFVNQLVDYHNSKSQIPMLLADIKKIEADAERLESAASTGDKTKEDDKAAKKATSAARQRLADARTNLAEVEQKIKQFESSPQQLEVAGQHAAIGQAVLAETAKLHAGDAENLRLWHEFLPYCRDEIQRVYQRLDIQFDYEHGESFYQDQLGAVVEAFKKNGLARESDDAICVFLDGFETPMIIQKKDGAFLYATSDLATVKYRMEHWRPDTMLYVVDHRQSEHFEKLFAATRLWGYVQVELRHISFGTVLGKDGKPYRTRSGDTVVLEGLLDEAVGRALMVVSENNNKQPDDARLTEAELKHVAGVVGHAAIKYADLSHNRTSDYKFDEDKMVAMEGNTATYMQYSYARTQSIIAKSGRNIDEARKASAPLLLAEPAERSLAIELLRFDQAVHDTVEDYRPNQLTEYLFALAKTFSTFFEKCHVIKAESDELRTSRLLLCDLTGRTIKQGLSLLGINVVNKM